jgi:hypothetical protein
MHRKTLKLEQSNHAKLDAPDVRKLSAAAATTAVGPALVGSRLAPSVTPRESEAPSQPRNEESPHQHAREDNLGEEGLQSELLIDLTLEAQAPHEVGAAGGGRLVVPVAGGIFEGPHMKGTVIAPSGDWILERPDGSRVLDVRLLLQTDDAQTIYVSWRGIAYTLPDGELAVGVYRGHSGKIAYHVYPIL